MIFLESKYPQKIFLHGERMCVKYRKEKNGKQKNKVAEFQPCYHGNALFQLSY